MFIYAKHIFVFFLNVELISSIINTKIIFIQKNYLNCDLSQHWTFTYFLFSYFSLFENFIYQDDVFWPKPPRLLPLQLLPHSPHLFFSTSSILFETHWVHLVVPVNAWSRTIYGRTARFSVHAWSRTIYGSTDRFSRTLYEVNWFSFLQQPSIANGFSVKGGTLLAPPPSILRFCLFRSCAGFVPAVTHSHSESHEKRPCPKQKSISL